MIKKETLGIVIRYADSHFGENINTIKEHNEILARMKSVYVGKVGKPLSDKYLLAIKDESIDTRLLLATRGSRGFEIYTAPVVGAEKGRVNKDMVPAYYSDSAHVACWFLLKHPLRRIRKSELSRWVVRSSGQPLIESLYFSMSGLFIAALRAKPVQNFEGLEIKAQKRKRAHKSDSNASPNSKNGWADEERLDLGYDDFD